MHLCHKTTQARKVDCFKRIKGRIRLFVSAMVFVSITLVHYWVELLWEHKCVTFTIRGKFQLFNWLFCRKNFKCKKRERIFPKVPTAPAVTPSKAVIKSELSPSMWVSWGPFLKLPSNLSGPKAIFQDQNFMNREAGYSTLTCPSCFMSW